MSLFADVPASFSSVLCPDPAAKGTFRNVSLAPLVLIQFLQLGVVDMCPSYVPSTKSRRPLSRPIRLFSYYIYYFFAANKCNETLTTFKSCVTSLKNTLYPIPPASQAATLNAAAPKKSVFQYINDRLAARGINQH